MKYLSHLIIIILILFKFLPAQRENNYSYCGTPPMAVDDIFRIKAAADEWLSMRPRNEAIHIFVAWHVITGNSG